MKKITRLFGLGFLSVAALSSFTSCEKTGFKVGLLCLHGQTSTYDNNFIDGYERACKKIGLSKDQYDIRTDVSEALNDTYTAAKEWAEDGYSIIFSDSFGHQDGMIKVAEEYPDIHFCSATGTLATTNHDRVPNFHNAFASIYEGRYLAGIVAGQKLKEMGYEGKAPTIGYVGAFDYAEVISGFTAFYLGAKSVVPDVTMKVKYTYSWYDYSAEALAAQKLISNDYGCKLISQHADSSGAPLICERAGVPNVSYNISTKRTCPNTYLVASKIDWEPYFEMAIKAAKDKYDGKGTGNFSYDYCGNIAGGSVQLCEYGNNVSDTAKSLVETAKQELENHKRYVFDTSKFTIGKKHVTEYMADTDGDYKPDKNVVRHDETHGIDYIAESLFLDPGEQLRSAPYFASIIDGITIVS